MPFSWRYQRTTLKVIVCVLTEVLFWLRPGSFCWPVFHDWATGFSWSIPGRQMFYDNVWTTPQGSLPWSWLNLVTDTLQRVKVFFSTITHPLLLIGWLVKGLLDSRQEAFSSRCVCLALLRSLWLWLILITQHLSFISPQVTWPHTSKLSQGLRKSIWRGTGWSWPVWRRAAGLWSLNGSLTTQISLLSPQSTSENLPIFHSLH